MKLANFTQFSILNKIFNIYHGEWLRVGMSFLIQFFYRIGFVIGWTIIVALFVEKYGISNLPYLFILNAFFIIFGSIFILF